MQPDRFTTKSQEGVAAAQRLASEHRNTEVAPAHLLLALLDQEDGLVAPVLQKLGADVASIRQRTLAAIEGLPRLSGDAVDGRLDHDLEQALAIEVGGEGLADAAHRVLQARALLVELLQALLQLARHLVELLAQRGELVVALGRDLDREVARARRRAACRKASIWRCSERETSSAKVKARTKKPARMPAASRRPLRTAVDSLTLGASTATRSSSPRKPGVLNEAAS